MIYRLYTEDLNRKEVIKIITKYYQGFTIIEATGFWRLNKEKTIIIEIVTVGLFFGNIENIVDEIKKLNNQESILVARISGDSSFI